MLYVLFCTKSVGRVFGEGFAQAGAGVGFPSAPI